MARQRFCRPDAAASAPPHCADRKETGRRKNKERSTPGLFGKGNDGKKQPGGQLRATAPAAGGEFAAAGSPDEFHFRTGECLESGPRVRKNKPAWKDDGEKQRLRQQSFARAP